MPGHRAPAAERFWAKVRKTSGCWIWTAGTNAHGYGRLSVDGEPVLAHRFSYALNVGPIPDGATLDHLCRVRLCVRPTHLEPVTLHENKRRGASPARVNAAKTECIRGHPFTEANTITRKHGWRECRTCHNADQRDRYRRNKTKGT